MYHKRYGTGDCTISSATVKRLGATAAKALLVVMVLFSGPFLFEARAAEAPPVFERSLCCFSNVAGLAVDTEGNIYVAEFSNNRIVKLRPDGSVITSWATGDNPSDVQVDGNGVVWVASGDGYSTPHAIHRYTSNGTLISLFTQFNSAGQFAFGPGDVVYVLDHHFGNVRKFTVEGTLITSWSFPGGFQGGRPSGIAVDSNGWVYIGITTGYATGGEPWWETGEIRIYSPDGVLLGQVPGSARGGKLRIDSNDHLYQTLGPSVRKFTASGEVLWEIASPDTISLDGLALDAQGRIYVGGSGGPNSKIHIFAPGPLRISIDTKPGSFPNSINPKNKGVIPVAILTTDTFDATTIDPATVLFGATGTEAAPVRSALEDVDGDGDIDLILHFSTQATGIKCGDTSASLTGETLGGQMIAGSDSINTVGCK